MRRDVMETTNGVRDLYLAWPDREINHAGKSMVFQSYYAAKAISLI